MRWIYASLSNGMIASVGLPLIVSLALSVGFLSEKVLVYREAGQLVSKTEVLKVLGALVHEQQKERGATSVYLNSGGASFGDRLAAQRTQVAKAQNRRAV